MNDSPTSASRKSLPFFVLAFFALVLGGAASAQLPLVTANDSVEVTAALPNPSISVALQAPTGESLDAFDYGQWMYGRTPGPEVALFVSYEYLPVFNTLYLTVEPEGFPAGYDLYWNDMLLDSGDVGSFVAQLNVAALNHIYGEGFFPIRDNGTHDQFLADASQHFLGLDLFVDEANRPTEELTGRIVATVTVH